MNEATPEATPEARRRGCLGLQYRLRTLLLLLAVIPPVLAFTITQASDWIVECRRQKDRQAYSLCQPLPIGRIVILEEDEQQLGIGLEE